MSKLREIAKILFALFFFVGALAAPGFASAQEPVALLVAKEKAPYLDTLKELVSIESGSLRVTTTRGFFLTDMSCPREVVQTSLTRVSDTALPRGPGVSADDPTSPSVFSRDFFEVVRFGFPSSLAEGRAKTRTRKGTGFQAEGQSAGRGLGSYG